MKEDTRKSLRGALLLLLGAAIIALALGLLLLWIGIWLIAEVMAGLIRSIGSLYREWCYKEVPAV
jgi:multisubunit Na+/H+ antiporter MnhG subunit